MKVVLSWLRESCPVDLSPEELGELLDSKGMHVESIDRPWEGLDGVVVARVVEVRDHPDSEKLCIARIDVGAAEREVVVGVRNMAPGDLVPYAGPGSRVPGLPEPLSRREIRGVASRRLRACPGSSSGMRSTARRRSSPTRPACARPVSTSATSKALGPAMAGAS